MRARRLLLIVVALTSGARADDKLPDGAVRRMSVKEDGDGTLFCVAFSLDGQTLAVGGSLKRVHLFDVKTGELVRSFGNHIDNVWTVAWSPDGKTLCSGGRADFTLRAWDPRTGDELKPFEGHRGGITRIRVFRDGKRLIMSGGTWDPTIRVWDIAKREQLLALGGHTDFIDSMDLASHGRLAISSSYDGSLRLWDLTRGREIWRRQGEESRANSGHAAAVFSPDGRMFAFSDQDGRFEVRETVTRLRCLPGAEHSGSVMAICFSPDGRRVAFTRQSQQVVIWDTRTGEELKVYRGHRSTIRGLAFAPDGRTLASCGDDDTILIWNVPATVDELKRLSDSLRNDHLEVLGSDNAVIARYATRALVSDPGPVVAALARRIKPTEAGDTKNYEQWIKQLASPRFAEREQASAELERAGERVEQLLHLAAIASSNTEQQRRLERLMEKLDRRIPSGEELWQLRAVAVLEQRGDADSRAHLGRLAAGAPSRLTTESHEALERLR